MRRHLRAIAIASFLVFAAAAARADGYEPVVTAAPVASLWTGFYANAGFGYGLWGAGTTTVDPARGCVSCATTDHAGRGWLGEVGLGYDYRFTDRIVGGVLFNYDLSDMRGRTSDAVFTTGTTSNDRAWFVGARAGWLMTPDVLNYLSVGYTQTHFSGASLHNAFTGALLVPPARLQSYDAGGWFLGGGLEVAMHGGWFWRSEVRYADYGNRVRTETGITPLFNVNFDPVVGTATSQIVYKLDWGR